MIPRRPRGRETGAPPHAHDGGQIIRQHTAKRKQRIMAPMRKPYDPEITYKPLFMTRLQEHKVVLIGLALIGAQLLLALGLALL